MKNGTNYTFKSFFMEESIVVLEVAMERSVLFVKLATLEEEVLFRLTSLKRLFENVFGKSRVR